MHTRLWLASAVTVAVAGTGTFVASPTLHGQTGDRKVQVDKEIADDAERIAADVAKSARDAWRHGFDADLVGLDVKQIVEQARRAAQEAARELDVDTIVNDAMQSVSMVGGGHPRIGVSTRDVTAEEAKAAGLAGITGAFVSEVPTDSVAAKAGLQANDIIVSVDGETIRSARHLARMIGETPEGRPLQVGYVRGTTKSTATMTPETGAMAFNFTPGDRIAIRKFDRMAPGERGGRDKFDLFVPGGPEGGREFFFRNGPEGGARFWLGRPRLGVSVQPLTDQLATYFGVKDGVLVTSVAENSVGAKGGLKAGDVITAVNGKPVTDTGDVVDALQGVEGGKSVPVEITRDRKSQTLTVTLETPSNTNGDRPAPRRQRFTA